MSDVDNPRETTTRDVVHVDADSIFESPFFHLEISSVIYFIYLHYILYIRYLFIFFTTEISHFFSYFIY